MNSSCQILIKLDGLKTERNSYDSQRLEEKFTSSTLKWRKAGHRPADNCYSHPPDAFKLLLISPSSDCLTHRPTPLPSSALQGLSCVPFPNQPRLPRFSVCLSKRLCCFMLYIQTCYLFLMTMSAVPAWPCKLELFVFLY